MIAKNFNIEGWRTWQARAARAYNGGLGADPYRGPGTKPLAGVRGKVPFPNVKGFTSVDVHRMEEICAVFYLFYKRFNKTSLNKCEGHVIVINV